MRVCFVLGGAGGCRAMHTVCVDGWPSMCAGVRQGARMERVHAHADGHLYVAAVAGKCVRFWAWRGRKAERAVGSWDLLVPGAKVALGMPGLCGYAWVGYGMPGLGIPGLGGISLRSHVYCVIVSITCPHHCQHDVSTPRPTHTGVCHAHARGDAGPAAGPDPGGPAAVGRRLEEQVQATGRFSEHALWACGCDMR